MLTKLHAEFTSGLTHINIPQWMKQKMNQNKIKTNTYKMAQSQKIDYNWLIDCCLTSVL